MCCLSVFKYKVYRSVWYSVHTIDHVDFCGMFGQHCYLKILDYLKKP